MRLSTPFSKFDSIIFEFLSRTTYVVNVCSNEYNLHVNLLKTKVVIFRNRGNIKSEEKWYLNGESIEICNEFMYLGILLNYNGVFTNTQKMLSNQGKKAVFSLFSKIQDDYFKS